MKNTGIYMAAVLGIVGCMMWETPILSWAEPVAAAAAEVQTAEEQAAVLPETSQVLVMPTEADKDAESGPAMSEELLAAAQMQMAADAESAARQNLVAYALQFVGGRYRAGGNDPHTGADCSGFIKYVMQHGANITMNRSSREQATQGRQISADQMQPGDLLFYGNGSRVNHVAMYIGDGRIVHASTERTGIKTSVWNYRAPVRIASMF